MSDSSGTNLGERAQRLLKSLVERYIREGQPVGSRALSRDSGLELSPATIRNVMADLEDLGFLHSPHTSAGRVPTVQGYRFFVDTLVTIRPLVGADARLLAEELSNNEGVDSLVGAASSLLSDITSMAGLVMLPGQAHETLERIEFLALSENKVLVILVLEGAEVQNRVIRTARPYTSAELERAANYLNDVCAGKDLARARTVLLQELRDARDHMNQMMVSAIEIADEAFDSLAKRENLVVAGQTNLMGYGEFADLEKLRQIFDAFNRKRDILHLLDQSLDANGVQIFIGEESGCDIFDGCSVVAAPYANDGQVLGVLGVIGPKRMAYERVIPVVDLTARLLGTALNQRH